MMATAVARRIHRSHQNIMGFSAPGSRATFMPKTDVMSVKGSITAVNIVSVFIILFCRLSSSELAV